MSPGEFVAHDALVFWVGTLTVIVPLAGVAWLARRRIVAACDRFWDRVDADLPVSDDPLLASVQRYARSQVGKPYVYGPPMQSIPDSWYGPDGHIDRDKVQEYVDWWDQWCVKGSEPAGTWFDEFPGYQPPD